MKEEKGNLLMTLILRTCMGLGSIYFVNLYLDAQGFTYLLGFNAVTAATSAVLGMPGVGLLYGIMFFQIM